MSRLWHSGDKKEPAAGDSAGSFLPPAELLEAMPDAVLAGLRVLHMSGYAKEAVGRFGEFPASSHFLPKPFTAAQLAAVVRAALDELASPAPPA